ncbi:MAG TPA: malto-oligosyltrehalose trehalohydrolase [Vicinamibacteria bacterium]|nr:malto-oligosyltrehalose trehalohydrolase [Vicinamibacteria bacterium]
MDTGERRLPVGAEVRPDGTHFRVWAPRRRSVEVVLEGPQEGAHGLGAEGNGYFSGLVRGLAAGARYRFRLDGGDRFPDPASRFQPEGPHGPSEVVDPATFRWSDSAWPGARLRGQVLYELHVGTFTREGTYDGVRAHLARLRETGITLIELLPLADFPGTFNWGYDGVDLFAPTRLYGRPDDLRRLVDEAHRAGLAVILDVVYNHLGPDGNYLAQYAGAYFTDRYETDWGEAINFDGEDGGPVRELFLANARYWIEEYHFDGLRLDATQNIYDSGEDHILAALTRAVREAGRGRATIVVAENEPQDSALVRPPAEGGYGMDGVWNDDFHHSALVALHGRNEAYYTDYLGRPQELISAMKRGYLYQGQWYSWQKQRRGAPTRRLPRSAFVTFLENHDQVANNAHGYRAYDLSSPGRWRALTGLLLLGPGTPMLFQGQEFATSARFLFFADHEPDLGSKVRRGRREFLAQFRSLALPEWDEALPDPTARETFERCVIDHEERVKERHQRAERLHTDLLRLRREDPVFREQDDLEFDGAVLVERAFVLRWFGPDGDDRLLVVNLGRDLHFSPAPEPLLAPPEGRGWRVLWSSEDPRYGGHGTPPLETEDGWRIPGEAAVALGPGDRRQVPDRRRPRSWTSRERERRRREDAS